jgi:hypothetical protein
MSSVGRATAAVITGRTPLEGSAVSGFGRGLPALTAPPIVEPLLCGIAGPLCCGVSPLWCVVAGVGRRARACEPNPDDPWIDTRGNMGQID